MTKIDIMLRYCDYFTIGYVLLYSIIFNMSATLQIILIWL